MRLGPSHDPARGTNTPWDAQAVKAKDQMSALGPTRASATERGNGRYLRIPAGWSRRQAVVPGQGTSGLAESQCRTYTTRRLWGRDCESLY